MSKKDRGMTNAEIELAMDRLVMRCQREATKAVNRAASLYAGRLRQNAPVDEDKTFKSSKNFDMDHSANHIKATQARLKGGRPSSRVGFKVTKGLGWYMHFPDGGTVVRGTPHQAPQMFIEKTYHEVERPIRILFRNAIRKGFD